MGSLVKTINYRRKFRIGNLMSYNNRIPVYKLKIQADTRFINKKGLMWKKGIAT
jgi:hypothetical protein